MIWRKGEEITAAYFNRTKAREKTLLMATMELVAYFIALGDDQATADNKVSQISSDVASYIYIYTLGNKTPLIDAINASNLSFMDADAKAKLIGDLNI